MNTVTRSNDIYADHKENGSYLNSDFSINLAIKKFEFADETELESVVGRYKKGKFVGQLKGKLVWKKVIAGGWVRGVGVVSPNLTYAYRIVDTWTGEIIFPKGIDYEQVPQWEKAELHKEMTKVCENRRSRLEAENPTPKPLTDIEWEAKTQADYERLKAKYGDKFNIDPKRENESENDFQDRICDWLYEYGKILN